MATSDSHDTLMTTEEETKYTWPHNVTTYIYSIIAFILLMFTTITYISLLKKSYEYVRAREMIENPHTPSSVKRRATMGDGVKSNDWPAIRSSIFYGTLMTCSCLIAANVFTFAYLINSQMYDRAYEGDKWMISVNLYCQVVTFGVGKILGHTIFIMRLYFTFKDVEILRYKNSVFYLFGSMMVVGVLIIVPLFPISDIIANAINVNYTTAFSGVSAFLYFFDFVLALVILLLMINRLHKV